MVSYYFTAQKKKNMFMKERSNTVRGMGFKNFHLFPKYINENILRVIYIMPLLYPSYPVSSLESHTKLKGTHNKSKLKTHKLCNLKLTPRKINK